MVGNYLERVEVSALSFFYRQTTAPETPPPTYEGSRNGKQEPGREPLPSPARFFMRRGRIPENASRSARESQKGLFRSAICAAAQQKTEKTALLFVIFGRSKSIAKQ